MRTDAEHACSIIDNRSLTSCLKSPIPGADTLRSVPSGRRPQPAPWPRMVGSCAPMPAETLRTLAADLEIHVLTADTFGQARAELAGLPCRVVILGPERPGSCQGGLSVRAGRRALRRHRQWA
ncbi:MAG: hypothetical protein MZV65_22055 [Chromatiales bacterium]|nr:hypothetical protein [Chromatiales bacterium]